MNKKVLVTGAAGFIGFHLASILINEGYEVIGLDNISDYYDINLKYDRLKENGILRESVTEYKKVKSKKHANYSFFKADLKDKEFIFKLFEEEKFDYVINLAAQAGVRYSLKKPYTYLDSNIYGFLNLLEGCRNNKVKHFIYASSSSVYGLNKKMPLSTEDNVDHPISLYAATKKSNELMAHTYSHLFNIPTTGLRFFTVYGSWGRPDMAIFLFTKAILNGEPIKVFNYGKMKRDFTYVGDIVEGVVKVLKKIPTATPDWNKTNPNPSISSAPYRLFNIGNNTPIALMTFIEAIEKSLGIKAIKEMLPIQPGDVEMTYADVEPLMKAVGFKPNTSIQDGVNDFVEWYQGYYKVLEKIT